MLRSWGGGRGGECSEVREGGVVRSKGRGVVRSKGGEWSVGPGKQYPHCHL